MGTWHTISCNECKQKIDYKNSIRTYNFMLVSQFINLHVYCHSFAVFQDECEISHGCEEENCPCDYCKSRKYDQFTYDTIKKYWENYDSPNYIDETYIEILDDVFDHFIEANKKDILLQNLNNLIGRLKSEHHTN